MSKRTRLPTNVDRLLERIRSNALDHVLIDKTKPGLGKEPALRQLLKRATEVLQVSSVTNRPDGYGARTPLNGNPGSGKGGGPVLRVDDDPLPASTSELAAIANLTTGPRVAVDEPARIARDVLQQLGAIDSAFIRLENNLNRWDAYRATAELEDAPQCYVASVVHRLPWDDVWSPFVSTRFDGVLKPAWPDERPVCRWVYDFTRAHERIPSKDELLQYLARGMVRVQTGTSGRAS